MELALSQIVFLVSTVLLSGLLLSFGLLGALIFAYEHRRNRLVMRKPFLSLAIKDDEIKIESTFTQDIMNWHHPSASATSEVVLALREFDEAWFPSEGMRHLAVNEVTRITGSTHCSYAELSTLRSIMLLAKCEAKGKDLELDDLDDWQRISILGEASYLQMRKWVQEQLQSWFRSRRFSLMELYLILWLRRELKLGTGKDSNLKASVLSALDDHYAKSTGGFVIQSGLDDRYACSTACFLSIRIAYDLEFDMGDLSIRFPGLIPFLKRCWNDKDGAVAVIPGEAADLLHTHNFVLLVRQYKLEELVTHIPEWSSQIQEFVIGCANENGGFGLREYGQPSALLTRHALATLRILQTTIPDQIRRATTAYLHSLQSQSGWYRCSVDSFKPLLS